MSKRLFSTALAVGLFSATVAVQAATITFTHESEDYYFENMTNTWTGSFTVNNAFDDSGVTLKTGSYDDGNFATFLLVWDQYGKVLGYNDYISSTNYDSFLNLGALTDGTYNFMIGNWPNQLVAGTTTVDLNNVGASLFIPTGQDTSKLFPNMGNGHWNVTVTGVVPEPETWAMLLAGLAIVGSVARRRKQHMH